MTQSEAIIYARLINYTPFGEKLKSIPRSKRAELRQAGWKVVRDGKRWKLVRIE